MAKLILSHIGTVLEVQPVKPGTLLIGRGLACSMRIPDICIEPQHALLISDEKRSVLEPLLGVVRVNGVSIRSCELQPGDEIKIGRYTILFAPNYVQSRAEHQPPKTTHYRRKNPQQLGFLQILNGKHLGRIVSLHHTMIRFGRAGKCALISHRENGYYLSALEGNAQPTIKDHPISHSGQHLEEGDVLQVGNTRVQFLTEAGPHYFIPPDQIPQATKYNAPLH